MKILSKQIKECEETNWTKTTVLDLVFSYKHRKWRVLIRDYFNDNKTYAHIIKNLKEEIVKAYREWRLKKPKKLKTSMR